MRRVLVVMLLAFLAFDVSGLAAACDQASCDEPCPNDLSGGQCSPNCHDCSCCSLPRVTGGASSVALIAPSARGTRWIQSVDRLPAPEPADILHVPKLAVG